MKNLVREAGYYKYGKSMRTSFQPVKVGTRFLLCRIKMGNSTTGIPDSTEKHLHSKVGGAQGS